MVDRDVLRAALKQPLVTHRWSRPEGYAAVEYDRREGHLSVRWYRWDHDTGLTWERARQEMAALEIPEEVTPVPPPVIEALRRALGGDAT